MSTALPPTIDPVAINNWHKRSAQVGSLDAPWLHEEVGGRMAQRLQWIKRSPQSWANWSPVAGGLQTHAAVVGQYPKTPCFMVESHANTAQVAIKKIAPAWWNPARLGAAKLHTGTPPDAGVQMVWANMLLHRVADPQALIQQWHRALRVDGYLMFSCLGPDSLKELRSLYDQYQLGPCSHSFTDMHDWGDMLSAAGFAEPVMDMERIVLSFASPQRALQELRGLGRNWHPQRFASLRGRGYLERLHSAMQTHMGDASGAINLTFEVIYGHAFKPLPRIQLNSLSSVSMQDMRTMLAQRPEKRTGNRKT